MPKEESIEVDGIVEEALPNAMFLVEFVRVPDAQLGYLAFGWLTMGQVLCLPLLAVGAWLFFCDHPLPEGDVRTPKTSRGTRR